MTDDRLVAALQIIARQAVPEVDFLGRYEYRVVQQVGDRVDLQAVRAGAGLPDQPSVELRPGVAGASHELALGAVVLVGFVEADPARPYVAGFTAPGEAGHVPERTTLDADRVELGDAPTRGVARDEDEVDCGTLTITTLPLPATGVLLSYQAPGGGAPVTFALNGSISVVPDPTVVSLVGRISTASNKVFAE